MDHSVQDWIAYGDEIRRPLQIAKGLENSRKVVIIGAGLSGLTLAYKIAKKRPDISIELIEKSSRLGGVIETWKQGEWICDIAVNASRAHPAFWRLIDELGLSEQYSESNSHAKTRWIYTEGKRRKLSPLMMLKAGPLKIYRGVQRSRTGKKSILEVIPYQNLSDAMTLGIVNDISSNVDADFLMPSMTKFGENPPIKWKKVKQEMMKTYPIFTPRKGAVASLQGGMQTLIECLGKRIDQLENVRIHLGSEASSPESISEEYNIPLNSIIWTGPINRKMEDYTSLDIYAIGYDMSSSTDIQIGYGTLIPDQDLPISGILHESDVHSTSRAPYGHRIFRVMSPVGRNASKEDVKLCLKRILSPNEPVLFEHIGCRKIPKYPPGYMHNLAQANDGFSRAGWFFSGVSVTHIVAEAERISSLF